MSDKPDFKLNSVPDVFCKCAEKDDVLAIGKYGNGRLGDGGEPVGRRPYEKPAIRSSEAFERGALAGCGVVMADFPCNGLS